MQASSRSHKDIKLMALLSLFVILILALAWPWLPQQDPETYFDFADKRSLWGIPNFFDVMSNLFFGLVGIFGFTIMYKGRNTIPWEYLACVGALSLGVFLTAFGSAYFHWAPHPEALFWDRLPMAIGFASLLSLFILDNLKVKKITIVLLITNLIAVASVMNISWGLMDLRPYIGVQFGFLLLILLIVLVVNKGKIPRKYIFMGFALYILAKVLEGQDLPIFEAVGISGHTLKHIAAATGVLYLNQGIYKLFFPTR